MEIRQREIVDWEPLQVELVLKRKVKPSKVLLEFVPQWMRQRGPNGICGCTIKDGQIGLIGKRGSASFACEWMCDACLRALAATLEKQFPEVDHIEIGLEDDSPVLPPAEFIFIKVPTKKVTLEDGSVHTVEAFEISKSCVTVGQYEAFAAASGYETRAEREGFPGARNYRDNELLLSKRNRERYPAYVMAYEDAAAYCRWAEMRLPTELEWLAASILDEAVVEDFDEFLRRANALRRRADALEYAGNEWTSTRYGDGRIIVRSEPRLVPSSDWAECQREAFAVHPGDCDLLHTFRVCRA